jgi:hypothetical protein
MTKMMTKMINTVITKMMMTKMMTTTRKIATRTAIATVTNSAPLTMTCAKIWGRKAIIVTVRKLRRASLD